MKNHNTPAVYGNQEQMCIKQEQARVQAGHTLKQVRIPVAKVRMQMKRNIRDCYPYRKQPGGCIKPP